MPRLPTMWVVIGSVLAVLALYGYGHHKGWAERDAEMQAEIAIKNEESRAREQKLTEQINQTSTELKEANDAITQKQSSLDRAISAGRVRFPASRCVQASPSAATASGNRDEARADADTETLRLIAQIAADGDRAIVQLNACIDAYNQVREQVNGQR
jgi:Ni,Fe-hydrogenase III large subunit